MCEVCQMAHARFVTSLPKRTAPVQKDQADEFLGGAVAQEVACHEGSDVSSGGEGGEKDGEHVDGPKASKEAHSATATATPSSLTGQGDDVCKLRPSRQGLNSQAWLSLLNLLAPGRVVLAGPLTFHGGLVVAVMQHNDSRLGLGPCPLVAFSAEVPPKAMCEWSSKHVKWWQAAHLCLHTVDAALQGYALARHKAMTSNTGLCVGVPAQKTLGGFVRRMLKREGSNTAGSGAAALPEVSLAPPQGMVISKFIQPQGNFGVGHAPFRRPVDDKPQADSDDDGHTPSNDMAQTTMMARNQRYFQKHSVKVQLSSDSSVHGLFAVADLAAETQMPVKGPWFETLKQVQEFLSPLPDEVRTMLMSRLVRVDLQADKDGEPPRHIFKVITCPVGFVNHFTGLSNQPNCALMWMDGVAVGEYNFMLKVTKAVKAGEQLLLNYGPLHPCTAKPAKLTPKKRARSSRSGHQ